MPATSVFILPLGDGSQNLTFALNIPSNSDDIFFHLAGPASYAWVAVGTGREMKDSLMFLLYQNANGDGVTLSPRLSTGTVEPVYSSSLDVEVLPGTGLSGDNNSTMVVNARCANCQRWKTGSLDLKSTAQEWIYALGPDSVNIAPFRSDSKTASIERHSEYGRFTLDMLQATGGPGGLSSSPSSFTHSTGSTQDGHPSSDSNWPAIIHALAACVAFILLMPTGVILLRVLPSQSVRWHWANQTLASLLAFFGVAIGIYLSTMYTRSQSFDSAHQIIGFVCAGAVVFQWLVGFWHHSIYKRTQRPTKYQGPIHRHFGRMVVVLAVVNGGIGLSWSNASYRVIVGYIVAVVVIGVVVIAVVVWNRWFSSLSSSRAGGSQRRWWIPARRKEWISADAMKDGSETNIHLTHFGDDSRYNQLG